MPRQGAAVPNTSFVSESKVVPFGCSVNPSPPPRQHSATAQRRLLLLPPPLDPSIFRSMMASCDVCATVARRCSKSRLGGLRRRARRLVSEQRSGRTPAAAARVIYGQYTAQYWVNPLELPSAVQCVTTGQGGSGCGPRRRPWLTCGRHGAHRQKFHAYAQLAMTQAHDEK